MTKVVVSENNGNLRQLSFVRYIIRMYKKKNEDEILNICMFEIKDRKKRERGGGRERERLRREGR